MQNPSIPYSVDPRFLAEQARLARQHQLITYQVMGGLFAALPPTLEHIKRGSILSFCCGSGDWALDCAMQYPHAEVLGIDIRGEMLRYAAAVAGERHLKNLSFRSMDITKPLDFPPETFDYIDMHYMEHVLPSTVIEAKIHEFLRILKPGGGFCRVVIEDGITDAQTQRKMNEVYHQTMQQSGRPLAPPPVQKTFSYLIDLRRSISSVGFSLLKMQSYLLDYSAGQPLHQAWVENQRIGIDLLAQSRISENRAAWDILERSVGELKAEQDSPNYTALAFILQIFALKPAPAIPLHI
jgi:ubiquinone/menaquinone biosynthesis C-methylase UbiE